MGTFTDAKIEAWQSAFGIEPATGDRLRQLEELSGLAVDLIKAIELDKSGIRDGAGSWIGCNPIDEIVFQMGRLIADPTPPPRADGIALTEDSF